MMVLLVCLSSVFSSLGIIYGAGAVRASSPLLAMGAVYLLAGGMFWLTALARGRRWNISRVVIPRSALTQYVFARLVGVMFFGYSLLYTASAKVVVLTKIEPYLVMFWMWLLHREKPTGKNVTLLAIHVAGAVLLSMGNTISLGVDQWGDLLLLFGMCCFAYSYPMGKKLLESMDPLWLSTVTNLAVGGMLLVLAGVLGGGTALPASQTFLVDVLGASFLGIYVGLGLWLYTVRAMEPWVASALRTLGPLVAAPVAWVMYDERLSAVQIVGAGLVLFTSALLSKVHGKKSTAKV